MKIAAVVRRVGPLLMGVATGLTVAPAGALAQTAAPNERLTLTKVEGQLGEGRAYEFERGVLRVPQNRAKPDGPVFELVFHRFPALPDADPSTPPIIHLNGGPGWPGFRGELGSAAFMENNVLPRVRFADMIVVGQRGIGTSAPNTACDPPPEQSPGEAADLRARLDAATTAARVCREKWEAEGVDLQGITVIEAAHDVRDVVDALGYDKVQIHGGSFGSHWGMAVLRYHPDIVARALLNGMEGPDHTYDMPGWVLAALERVAADAEASGVFDDRIPPGGLIEGFRETIARVEQSPIPVEVIRRGGRDTVAIKLNADDIRGLWGGFTQVADGHRMRGWPADLIRLFEGDYEAAANVVLSRRSGFGGRTAAYFMFDCGSGISPGRLAQLMEDPGADVVGPLGAWYQSTCTVWDADLGEVFRKNFDTDIPTVIVHGNWDLSTPLENALELRPHFKNHRFVLVERGTHGALGEALRSSVELREALDVYMATGDMSGFPDVVTLPAPDWLPTER